ncbi:MAG: prepilin peptidase [Saccharofermentanales bacterium]
MFWTIYFGIILFLFGLIMGSFYNVCIYRIPEGLSIITPPSHCGNCNHRLGALDLIPVVSWLALGRKCRYCHAPIAWRYPLVELLTGVLFASLFLKFGLTWELPFYLVFVSILIMVTFIDIDHRIIPDRFVLAGLALAIGSLFTPWAISWKDALIGAAIGGGTLLIADLAGRVFFKKEGMGFGDVKLMAMAGIFLGIKQISVAFLLAVWIAAIVGVILLRVRSKDSDHYMPFGPFLALGCTLSIFFGNEIVVWYLSTFR